MSYARSRGSTNSTDNVPHVKGSTLVLPGFLEGLSLPASASSRTNASPCQHMYLFTDQVHSLQHGRGGDSEKLGGGGSAPIATRSMSLSGTTEARRSRGRD